MQPSGHDSQTDFTTRVIAAIKNIPRGRVATYGQIAAFAGNPRASRRVVWILNAYSKNEKLPWHRVINGKGRISLRPGHGYELQRSLLENEGITFGIGDTIDLDRFLWKPA